MQNEQVLGIFKFGKRQHIDQFVQGHVYMNTLEYFVSSETNPARRDKGEGTKLWLPSKVSFQIRIAGEFRAIPNLIGPIRYRHPDDLQVNVFCMYALRASQAKNLVHSRNLAFGDTYAVLTDGDEFLRRVSRAAEELGFRPAWGLVEYVDEASHHGPMGPFRKSSQFAYQSECRIVLEPGVGSVLSLQVGALTDIVSTGRLDELNQHLHVE